MAEINDVTKARPESVTPRTLQQRIQWTAPLNSIKQKATTLINTSSLISREIRAGLWSRKSRHPTPGNFDYPTFSCISYLK